MQDYAYTISILSSLQTIPSELYKVLFYFFIFLNLFLMHESVK